MTHYALLHVAQSLSEVPTFSSSLIKFRPIVSKIQAVKARQTDIHTQIKFVGVNSLQTVTIKPEMDKDKATAKAFEYDIQTFISLCYPCLHLFVSTFLLTLKSCFFSMVYFHSIEKCTCPYWISYLNMNKWWKWTFIFEEIWTKAIELKRGVCFWLIRTLYRCISSINHDLVDNKLLYKKKVVGSNLGLASQHTFKVLFINKRKVCFKSLHNWGI